MGITGQDTLREVILTESKTVREGYVKEEYFDVLDKIKAIPYMTKDMVVSVEQVANYYEVSKKAINTIIERHRDELETDGIMVLKGEELKEFKNKLTNLYGENHLFIGKRTSAFTILSLESVILIGFYLQNNKISKQLKKYLLEINPNLYKYFENKTLSISYKKRYENGFEDILYKLLGKYNNITKQVKCGKYHIDFVINNSIAIEIDENNHANYNRENEKIRQSYIEKCGYKVLRYNTNNDVFEFIGEIIEELKQNKYNLRECIE